MRKPMTKQEVLQEFRQEILPAVVARYGKDDRVAKAEEWSNYTDALCTEGRITRKQDDTWTNPF